MAALFNFCRIGKVNTTANVEMLERKVAISTEKLERPSVIAKLTPPSASHAGQKISILLHGPLGSLQTERLTELERRLRLAVKSVRCPKIEVDLTYAQSYGTALIDLLLNAARLAKERSGQLRVVGDHGGVLKMLKLEDVLGK